MSEDELVKRVARAIYLERCRVRSLPAWETLTEYQRYDTYCEARAAIAALPQQPAALPAEPPPGTVRVRVAVVIEKDGSYCPGNADKFRTLYGMDPDAILVADVKPLTPPEIAATVEGGR